MKIRLGNTPAASKSIRAFLAPRVIPSRIVKSPPIASPSLPPVHFFAEADVDAGGEATLRSEALSNRTGQPVEIHEIRLAARISRQTSFAEIDVGSFMRVQLAMNDHPLTNAFVPMWLLGKTESSASQAASGTEAFSMYVWRLSRPWHIPPGAKVTAQFQHTGAVRFSARAQIGLAGRYVENRAKTSIVPYASAYISKPFGYAETGFDESSEGDLVNVTKRVVVIDRIIGRVGVARTTAEGAIGTISDFADAGPVRLVTMRMHTSRNLPIIRDYSTVQGVFGYSRAIEAPHSLPPGDFYRIGVKKIAGPTIATPFLTWNAQVNASIIGSREEAI
jgi:hypothetical protein